MNWQILFSGKDMKIIISLSSDEFSHSLVKVKFSLMYWKLEKMISFLIPVYHPTCVLSW